ncbi:MAG: hypothetical protein GY898_05800 [Proteobacteria bacterium]|nr:hypothetical protein [Pseudomonadota bacterium]
MSELADYALELLNSSDIAPSRNSRLDGLLRDLADQVVDPDDPASEFDLLTLSALVDGSLPPQEASTAAAGVRRNPRKLQQFIELTAANAAFEEDAPRPSLELHVAAEFEPPSRVAPVIDLEARRRQRRLLGIAGSIAALLMIGLVFLITTGPAIPDPLDARLGSQAGTVRSAAWTVGETLELSASVDADASWAVVAAAAATPGSPARLWVARTSDPGTDDGRVQFTEVIAAPAGRRAYLVVASATSLDALPAFVTDWEAELRSRGGDASFVRDLQAVVDEGAGEHTWRVSEALPVTVAEGDDL